ncbi:ABC transporter substrate-binding protein [Methylobacterium sp. A49B]
MRRRDLTCLIIIEALCTLRSHRAMSAGKLPRIVFVTPIGRSGGATDGDSWNGLVTAFLQGLRDFGYIDGTTMKFEFYSAEGKPSQVDEIAARILEDPPDVVVAGGGGANEVAHAFKRLTRTVPIVMANSSDPVMQGLVLSLARPGGNITGFSGNTGPDFEVKRLELLREIAPYVSKIAYLGLKIDWESPAGIAVRSAAERFDAMVIHAEHASLDYSRAFDFILKEKVQGLFVGRNPWNYSNRHAIAAFAADRRIAAVYPTREYIEVAGLISYGPSLSVLYRRAARYVDKILKGDKPADLPVDQPSKFELVINTKAALAIGITPPATLFARADEIID